MQHCIPKRRVCCYNCLRNEFYVTHGGARHLVTHCTKNRPEFDPLNIDIGCCECFCRRGVAYMLREGESIVVDDKEVFSRPMPG